MKLARKKLWTLPMPRRFKRPCDWGLQLSVLNLESQLGTIEAYNRLVEAAVSLKRRIDAGDTKEALVPDARSVADDDFTITFGAQ